MAKNYRIKNPRCWVIRWHKPGTGPSTDYLGPGDSIGSAPLTDRAGAAEYPNVEAARAVCGPRAVRFWLIVRRGRVSR